jgi:sugar O-acyltransferase (sialic acid O-acetyltransferase NeuD family)
MVKVVIVGQGVAAKVLASYIQSESPFELAGFTVDDEYMTPETGEALRCIPLSKLEREYPSSSYSILLGIGYAQMNQARRSMFKRLQERGYVVESFISPKASIASNVEIGQGCIVLPGSVIEPYATVGDNTVLWSNVTVAHHSSVGSHCWLASGTVVSGQAKVGDNSFIGVNATIVNEVEVGEGCFIGAGALITKNTKENSVHITRSSEMLRYSASEYAKFFMK